MPTENLADAVTLGQKQVEEANKVLKEIILNNQLMLGGQIDTVKKQNATFQGLLTIAQQVIDQKNAKKEEV